MRTQGSLEFLATWANGRVRGAVAKRGAMKTAKSLHLGDFCAERELFAAAGAVARPSPAVRCL